MKLHDISQEVFSCCVFPGDTVPERKIPASIENGDICNLTDFTMCAHNGTHIDAPYHFYKDGKTVDEITLEHFVGKCFVTFKDGDVTATDAENILNEAKNACPESAKRILIGGRASVTEEAARVFAKEKILLIGNESQTVGPENAPAAVHYELLGAEVVLLEGIRLYNIQSGVYTLSAAPLKLGGCDGAPCRAVLIDE